MTSTVAASSSSSCASSSSSSSSPSAFTPKEKLTKIMVDFLNANPNLSKEQQRALKIAETNIKSLLDREEKVDKTIAELRQRLETTTKTLAQTPGFITRHDHKGIAFKEPNKAIIHLTASKNSDALRIAGLSQQKAKLKAERDKYLNHVTNYARDKAMGEVLTKIIQGILGPIVVGIDSYRKRQ